MFLISGQGEVRGWEAMDPSAFSTLWDEEWRFEITSGTSLGSAFASSTVLSLWLWQYFLCNLRGQCQASYFCFHVISCSPFYFGACLLVCIILIVWHTHVEIKGHDCVHTLRMLAHISFSTTCTHVKIHICPFMDLLIDFLWNSCCVPVFYWPWEYARGLVWELLLDSSG